MRRSPLLLAVLLVVVLTLAWWFLLISPRNARISEAEDQLVAAQDRASQLETQIVRLREIKDNEISYLFAIGEMEQSIPEAPELDAFLEDLDFLAQRAGVDLSSVSAAPPVPDPGGTELFAISVTMAIEGEYFEILGFLYGIEDMERIVRIDSVTVSPIQIDVTTTTTTTLAEGQTTTSTTTTTLAGGSSTTTSTVAPSGRPAVSTLTVSLTATIFTRTPVVVVDLPPESTTTTTTVAEGGGS